MRSRQLPLFQFLNIARAKKVGEPCHECGRPVKWYCKTLDQRLINLANEVKGWMNETKRQSFDPNLVWEKDPNQFRKVSDVNKLHYWKIIKQCEGRVGWWEFTPRGESFMKGKIQLAKRLWVFNNQVMEEDDEMVHVDNADPRWQTTRQDYANDYIPQAIP